MTAFSVDRDVLLDAIDQLQRLEGRLETALDDADREVNRLHGTWTGAAAQEHRDAHARWRRGAAEMHEALVVMRKVAAGAHENYGRAVAANVSMWRL